MKLEKKDLTFAQTLEGKTLEELKAIEVEIVKEADENDKKLAELKFDLPAEGYKEAAEAIREFLNKQVVKWQYTLGMKNMYEFFDPNVRPTDIPYPMFDTVLRTLGALEFKGYDEWCAVININNYVEPLREKYVAAAESIYEIAERHNDVINAIDKIQNPQKTQK